MIVVDTSAVVAFILYEKEADALEVLFQNNDLIMSSGTYAELSMIGTARGFMNEIKDFMRRMRVRVELLTASDVQGHTDAFERWGKGRHPAKLNYGDCFAYALAKKMGLPLACVGDDFSQTDIDVTF